MCRLSRWFPLLCLLVLACGNDSPQAPPAESFSPEKFIGAWTASVPQYTFPARNAYIMLRGSMTVETVSYRIDLSYGDDTLKVTFVETGEWHWDKENEALLFFDFQKSLCEYLKITESRGAVRWERAVLTDSLNGAWYCSYKNGDGWFTLFQANGKGAGAFERILLTTEE